MSRLTQADPLAIGLGLALVVAVGCVAALGWFCYRLLVERGQLLLAMPEAGGGGAPALPRGLRPGSFLSDFALPRLDGGMATLTGLRDRPLLLAFVGEECLFSRAFVRELAGLEHGVDAPHLALVVVGEVADPEIVALATRSSGTVLLDGDGQVARLMRVGVTPAGYWVDRERQTVGPLLTGPAALLAAARGERGEDAAAEPLAFTPLPKRDAAAVAPLGPGDGAPRFTLPTAEGAEWPLAAHLGQSLALLFADPGCPPCRMLLGELSRRGTEELVVISRGDLEENRRLSAALGPAATVVVQQHRDVARAFRTLETPAAFLIDAHGAIAAGPAVGAEEVLALISRADTGAANGEMRAAGRLRMSEE